MSSDNASPSPQSNEGHLFPASFSSPAPVGFPNAAVPVAPVTPTVPIAPVLPTVSASGVPSPLASSRTGSGTSSGEGKPSGGFRIVGVLVAAALVGGIAGFGGAALGANVFANSSSEGTSQPPSTIAVNNPGSVNETTAIAAATLPSVVTLDVIGSSGAGGGSGVIISADGYVLTNAHVITLGGSEASPRMRVTTSDGRIFNAAVVGTDPIYDLAVVQLEGATELKPITFGNSSELNVGDTAVAVGSPLGLSNSVTTGVVSALNRSIQVASSAVPEDASVGQDQNEQQEEGEESFRFDIPGIRPQQASQSITIAVVQTDAAINPGNSGGALVDSKGDLIGINVAIARAGGGEEGGSIGLGFAIPSDIAKRIADELISTGEPTHGLLGASVSPASLQESPGVAGAYINEITPNSAAAAAGIRAGDVVTDFNGVRISNASDLTAQVRALAAGSEASLTYVRNDRVVTVEVTLGALSL